MPFGLTSGVILGVVGLVFGWILRELYGRTKGRELVMYINELEDKLELPHRYGQAQQQPAPIQATKILKSSSSEAMEDFETRVEGMENAQKKADENLKKIMKKLGV